MKSAIVAVVGLGFAASAQAAILVDEPFTYANGNLVGNDAPTGGVWAAHSGAGSMPIQVSAGKITVTQGAGSREDANVPFEGGATAVSGTVLYSAFELTVNDPGVAVVESQQFAHFLQGLTNFTARVYVSPPTVGGSGYRLALSNDNSITDADGEARTANLDFGTTYTVITEYDIDTPNSTRLWVNPVTILSPSINATDPGFANAVGSYAMRQGAGNTNQIIDNLRVGTSFGEVVPEPGSLSLIGLAGLTALCRRRR